MIEVSASLLSLERENATRTLYNLEVAKINYFHIDVMDGKFVERDTTEIMKDYALTISHISNLGLDVHLMVENVEEFIDEYSMLEPQIITFHIEAVKEDKERVKNIIEEIKNCGSKVGIAINPATSIEEIKEYLKYIHMVLIMTANPGKGGQGLMPETLEKVKELREYVSENNLDIDIEVDCGINNVTAKSSIEAGANILAVGSYLTSAENITEAVKSLRE